jgi:hypothetical protein
MRAENELFWAILVVEAEFARASGAQPDDASAVAALQISYGLYK